MFAESYACCDKLKEEINNNIVRVHYNTTSESLVFTIQNDFVLTRCPYCASSLVNKETYDQPPETTNSL